MILTLYCTTQVHYTSALHKCSLTADCSINDLCLLKDINEFSGFDEAIAQKSITSFSKNNWYLTEGLIPFALFSKRVPPKTKQELVN